MTQSELLDRLAGWIGEITEADKPALAAETHLVEDLGLDSLALAELAARVRRELGLKLKPGELRTDLRAGAVADFILAKQAGG